jgi:hypothetical protein
MKTNAVTFRTTLLCIGLLFTFPVFSAEVLLLKLNYVDNQFEGGKKLEFAHPAETFSITTVYGSPGDFGWIKLYFSEIDELLFHGEIFWMGCGDIVYPTDWKHPDEFIRTDAANYVFPKNGFENIWNSGFGTPDYDAVWSQVQNIIEVREILEANPEQTAKFLLYTPSAGVGDINDFKWIILLSDISDKTEKKVATSLPEKRATDISFQLSVSDNQLWVKTDNDASWSYKINNLQGQAVASGSSYSGNPVDISPLSPAVYIVSFYRSDGSFLQTRRFVKQ